MRIEGDIKVWTDGRRACARLYADGPEGPIIIHASAPLEPIRRLVARQFARRGVTVSGDDPAFKATVKRIGRRRALRRLQRMAPGAFQRGGLGPYLARQELQRRRGHRRALAQAGQPVGSKPVGKLAPGRRRRRRRPRWQALRRRLAPTAMPLRRALWPALPAAGTAAAVTALVRAPRPGGASATGQRASLAPLPAGGAGGPGGRTTLDEEGAPSDQEGDFGAAGDLEEVNQPDSDADAEDDTEEGTDPGEDEGDEGGDWADEDADDDVDEADVSGVPRDDYRRRLCARARLRAAMRLLAAAHHSPRARRRVHTIASLAGEGDRKAQKALAALAAAHRVQKARAGGGASGKGRRIALPPPTAALVPTRPALTPAGRPASGPGANGPARGGAGSSGKWWDIFAPWRRGIG